MTIAFALVALGAVTLTTWMTIGAVAGVQRDLFRSPGTPFGNQGLDVGDGGAADPDATEAFRRISRTAFRAGAVSFVLAVIALSTAAHLVIQSRSARSAVLVPIVIAIAPTVGVSAVAAAFISTAAAGFCHTLPASAKPLAIFRGSDAPGETPHYDTADLLRMSALLAPMHLAVTAVFAFLIWPLLGLPLYL